jgi:hypothetical protein
VYSTNLKRVIEQLLRALLSVPAAKSEDLGKIIDFRAVAALHKAVIGKVNPGFAI